MNKAISKMSDMVLEENPIFFNDGKAYVEAEFRTVLDLNETHLRWFDVNGTVTNQAKRAKAFIKELKRRSEELG